MQKNLLNGLKFELDEGAIFKKNKEGGIVIVRLDDSDSFFLINKDASPLFESILSGDFNDESVFPLGEMQSFISKLIKLNLLVLTQGQIEFDSHLADSQWISEFNLNEYANVENLTLGVYAGN